jgi:hypothetical protein
LITYEQVKDLGAVALARTARFVFGWYWSPSQRATLDQAERVAWRAYASHARSARRRAD